jgi:hypothetical protein
MQNCTVKLATIESYQLVFTPRHSAFHEKNLTGSCSQRQQALAARRGIKEPSSLFQRANEQPQPRYFLTATDPLEQFKGEFGFDNWN